MKETLDKLRASLVPIYGKGEAEAIIRLIFHYLKGWNLTDMLIHQEDELSPYIKDEVEKILQRLLKQEPIQYILGEAYWYGMNLKVAPGVLIPRPETAELVDLIIDQNKGREDLAVLDVCTGSGCIALALARNLPFAKVEAIDFSEEALKISRENANLLKTRVQFIKADIFDWSPSEKYDIIVSNPPYVMDKEALKMEKNILDFEPHEALFVRDEAPLVYYGRIADIALYALNPGGRLYFEINPLTSVPLTQMMESKGFQEVIMYRDSSGKERFLSCQLRE